MIVDRSNDSIKVKPVKAGDAKLWVYRHAPSVAMIARPPKIKRNILWHYSPDLGKSFYYQDCERFQFERK
jgi:hypothetical protein